MSHLCDLILGLSCNNASAFVVVEVKSTLMMGSVYNPKTLVSNGSFQSRQSAKQDVPSHIGYGYELTLHLFSYFRYLVEQREVEINIRDRWDSTPL